jgi:hypothetical protein
LNNLAAKKAAMTLGYNKEHWDQEIEMKELEVYWNHLAPEKQAAAIILGYDEFSWKIVDKGLKL